MEKKRDREIEREKEKEGGREHTDRVIAFRLGHVAAKSICKGKRVREGRTWCIG